MLLQKEIFNTPTNSELLDKRKVLIYPNTFYLHLYSVFFNQVYGLGVVHESFSDGVSVGCAGNPSISMGNSKGRTSPSGTSSGRGYLHC